MYVFEWVLYTVLHNFTNKNLVSFSTHSCEKNVQAKIDCNEWLRWKRSKRKRKQASKSTTFSFGQPKQQWFMILYTRWNVTPNFSHTYVRYKNNKNLCPFGKCTYIHRQNINTKQNLSLYHSLLQSSNGSCKTGNIHTRAHTGSIKTSRERWKRKSPTKKNNNNNITTNSTIAHTHTHILRKQQQMYPSK